MTGNIRKTATIFAATVAILTPVLTQAANVQTATARAEIVLPGYTPSGAVESVHKGMSWMLSSAQKSVRFMPNPIPARPDEPKLEQIHVSGISFPDLDCPTAYAEFTFKPGATGNRLGASGEIYRGCLYAFQKGFKANLMVTTYRAASTGLAGFLIGGIGKLVQGNDSENLTRLMTRMLDKMRENAPDMLVGNIEIPGKEIQQPDITAIHALIPAAPESIAAAPQTATAMGLPAASKDAAMIDARKNLNAMGLAYHSQDQFIAAIKRRDELAVKLFVEASGVDIAAKDASGKTPKELAAGLGSPALVVLLTPAQPAESGPPENPTKPTSAMSLAEKQQIMQQRIREQMMRQMGGGQ